MPEIDPNDLLEDLAVLEGLREPSPGAPRRQFRRFMVRADAELHPMDGARLDMAPIQVRLRDVSRGGVGFISAIPLEQGSAWRIQFLERGYPIDTMGLLIRHCRQVCPDVYLGGGQFCAQTGLLIRLGLNPLALDDDQDAEQDSFLSPGDLMP